MDWNKLPYAQRVEYFATGNCTVGTVSQVDTGSQMIYDSYVGKVRGVIVENVDGVWKFDTPDEAREAAEDFKRHTKELLCKLGQTA